MGFFTGAGKDGNESGGWVGGKHRGKPVKGKGGVGKPSKGKRGSAGKGGKGKTGAAGGFDRWG